MFAQKRFKSVYRSAQYDQSLLDATWIAFEPKLLQADCKDCQIVKMCMFIWFFFKQSCIKITEATDQQMAKCLTQLSNCQN